MEQPALQEATEKMAAARRPDSVDAALNITAQVLMLGLILLPEVALAQVAPGSGGDDPFTELTAFLKMLARVLIFDWGTYIAMITLAIQGYRWWTGRIDLMTLGGWGLGVGLVFFGPNIVMAIRDRSAGTIL